MIDTSMLKGTVTPIGDVLKTKDLTQHDVDTIVAMESLLEQGVIAWNGEMRWAPRSGCYQKVFVALVPPPDNDEERQ